MSIHVSDNHNADITIDCFPIILYPINAQWGFTRIVLLETKNSYQTKLVLGNIVKFIVLKRNLVKQQPNGSAFPEAACQESHVHSKLLHLLWKSDMMLYIHASIYFTTPIPIPIPRHNQNQYPYRFRVPPPKGIYYFRSMSLWVWSTTCGVYRISVPGYATEVDKVLTNEYDTWKKPVPLTRGQGFLGCTFLTDRSLSKWASSLPQQLQELELEFALCSSITEKGVEFLASNVPTDIPKFKASFKGALCAHSGGQRTHTQYAPEVCVLSTHSRPRSKYAPRVRTLITRSEYCEYSKYPKYPVRVLQILWTIWLRQFIKRLFAFPGISLHVFMLSLLNIGGFLV